MEIIAGCDFCDIGKLGRLTIRYTDLFASFVSLPSFREGHCLVIPRRHVERLDELTAEEAQSIFSELGRLSRLLDAGYGYGVMQKYMPLQKQNGVKMSHLHFHVFPREEKEDGLFPVPVPNDFSGFHDVSKEQVASLTARLK